MDALTLDEIRRAIPRELFSPNPLQSAWSLVRAAVCIALCMWLLARVPLNPGWPVLWEVPALATIWVLHGWVLVGVFLIGHDCIRERYADYYQERAFSIGYLAWLWRTPFVRRVDDKGFYVLARDSHVST